MERALVRQDGSIFIKLSHFVKENYIYVNWQGYLELEMVKEGSEELLKMIRELKVEKVLINNKNIYGPWSSANKWYANSWNPRAKEAGLRFMAVIVSDNIFTQLSLKGFEKVNKGSYSVFSHFDPAVTKEWLLSQS